MILLKNKGTSASIGTITDDDLTFLIDMLEEEDSEDRDYWIDRATLDYFELNGCEEHLLDILKDAIGESEGIEIEWSEA